MGDILFDESYLLGRPRGQRVSARLSNIAAQTATFDDCRASDNLSKNTDQNGILPGDLLHKQQARARRDWRLAPGAFAPTL